jgi:hypothetical protein
MIPLRDIHKATWAELCEDADAMLREMRDAARPEVRLCKRCWGVTKLWASIFTPEEEIRALVWCACNKQQQPAQGAKE